MSRFVPWTIADLLDFEYLLAAEPGADEAAERARDRIIFAEQIAPRLQPDERHDRRVIFKEWLTARRALDAEALPGGHFTAGWQTLLLLAALVGLGVGVSLTAGLLHYKGDEPVNVAWFFAWTVGVQLAVLFAALAIWSLRRATHLFENFRPLRWLLAGLIWSLSAGLRRLPGPQRERLRAGLATAGHRREIYGALPVWPLLIVTQLFGVCFNLGVLATLLLHVALSDVAFGWQSTLRMSPEEAHRVAAALALPWSFAPNAHPALDQVVASRFAYSQGIALLSPTAMASWWPFLCYAIAVYGLLVRGILLAWSAVSLRGALRALAFDHPASNALFRRLTGPMVQAQGSTALLEIPAQSASPRDRAIPGGACFALLASDLTLPNDALAARLRADYGWELAQAFRVQIDHPSANAESLAALEKAAANLAGVVVVVRAKRAPIKAIALFLEKVTAAAGVKAETLVLLVGRSDGGQFQAVAEEEFEHWQNFRAIHGLRVAVERWRPA